MNEKELREKFPPQKLESQCEFETMMGCINADQLLANQPFIDKEDELKVEHERAELDLLEIKRRFSEIRLKRMELEKQKRDVNRMYHSLKHDLIELNPRNSFVNVQ